MDNLRSQVEILTQIRDAAAKVGVNLDGVIAKLNLALVHSEQMAASSKKEVLELFKMGIASDPELAAVNWANRTVEGRFRQLVEKSVDRILANSIPTGSRLRGRIRTQLVDSILASTNGQSDALTG